MKLAMIGLGRMGGNMARRLAQRGHELIVYNRTAQVTRDLASEVSNMIPAFSLEEVVDRLPHPRIIWMMVPAGDVTEEIIKEIAALVSIEDILIDGGNSNFRDSMRRADWLNTQGIHFIDAGVSGGIWGLKEGYSLMLGGDEEVITRLTPIFQSLAPGPDRGWGRVGPHGAGHFVKMVHNGIEYGMMEAIAEGFDILNCRKDFNLDLAEVASIWKYGSVVRSWLLDLTRDALQDNPGLDGIEGWVADSGEGRWTVFEAINEDVPAPVITLSLMRRLESRQENSFATRLLAAMRNEFGGHSVKKSGSQEKP